MENENKTPSGESNEFNVEPIALTQGMRNLTFEWVLQSSLHIAQGARK